MVLKDIKNWSVEIEKKITEKWKNSELFRFRKEKKKIFSIDTPPPYVNAPIHMGHAVTYCYMDFFARFRRMQGFEVLFPLGLDNNGLPIEVGAEKRFKTSPFDVSRDKFIELCKKLLEEFGTESTDSFAKLGISFNSYEETGEIGGLYKTDSPEYRKVTQATFIELFKKGLIYEDSRINNWDPKLRTTIADSEIEREEKETDLNYVKFKIENSNESIVIATTRPELLCTSALIIYNPKDKRYKHLKGKKAITPIFGNVVDIIEHEDADPNFGTGLVFMSSSGGDQDAVRFLRKVGIKPISAIGLDGKMNENGGILKGLKTREARKEIIEKIKEAGLMEKQEKLMHSVPISERSKAEIEFVEMPEFYLNQLQFKKEIKKISKKIKFYPEFTRKILDDWIEAVNIDWPISRRRYYATPIPLWNAEQNGKKLIAVGNPGKYYEPWKQEPENSFEVFSEDKKIGHVKDFKNLKWQGETRVLDTWMDSSISELVMLQYSSNKNFFKKTYPCSLRPQGKEIIRTWLYYTILRGYLETKKPCFKEVWIHQHIADSKGYKMSKSKGNVINPQEIIESYGAEALRFWAAGEGDISKQDLKCSKERINAELKTLNKILNVSKFVMLFEKPSAKITLTELDKLFIDYIEDLTKRTEKSYEEYDFYNPATELRKFLWDIFASNYIELIKSRAYNQEKKFPEQESNSAKYTLHFLLERFLHLIYPIIPQITSLIAKEKGIDLLKATFPKSQKIKSNIKLVEKILEFNSQIWKEKKEKGISLRDEISGIKIPKELKNFEKDLVACHKLA